MPRPDKKPLIRRLLIILALALASFAILFASIVSKGVIANVISQMDNGLYGQFLATSLKMQKDGPKKPSNMVILALDDRTLNKLSAYNPETYRRYHVQVLENLLAGKPKAVIYDILFVDPHPDPAVDRALGEAMKKGPVISACFAAPDNYAGSLFAGQAYPNLQKQAKDLVAEGGFFPMPQTILDSVSSLGLANAYPDTDGVLRKMPVFFNINDQAFAGLSVSSFCFTSNTPKAEVRWAGGGFRVGKTFIPADSDGRTRIPILDQKYPIREVSFYDVYKNRVPPRFFEDKIVFIAATATGLGDNKLLPVVGYVPGVKVHANLLLAMNKGGLVRDLSFFSYYILVFIICLYFTFTFYHKRELSWVRRVWAAISGHRFVTRAQEFLLSFPPTGVPWRWWKKWSRKNYTARFFLILFHRIRERVEALVFQIFVLYVGLFFVFHLFHLYLRPTPLFIQVLLCHVIVNEFKKIDSQIQRSKP